MKEKLLFVTKGGDNFEEGFPYVIELSRTMNAGIVVLVIFDRQLSSVFDDVMAAAAFAEAGEIKTAKEILLEHEREIKDIAAKKFGELTEKYKEISGDLFCHAAIGDIQHAIKDFLKDRPNIDMILLSPTLSGNEKIFDINKLLKNITKPIVTISRPLQAEA